jgi:hypothetical protein
MPPFFSEKPPAPAPAPSSADPLDVEKKRDAAQLRLWQALGKASRDLIYITMQRSGGEPFGAPYELGLSTLTERLVRFFKQRGFFTFHSVERAQGRRARNRFTRHGATAYRGAYAYTPQVVQSRGVVERWLRYMRANRFFLVGTKRPPPPDAP